MERRPRGHRPLWWTDGNENSPTPPSSVDEELSGDLTAADFDARPRSKCGVRYDTLFLPDGTEIRTKYFGNVKVATIIDGEVTWEGKPFESMSQLARAMRGDMSNNAWKVLELKRPGDARFQLADFLRR